MAIWGLLYALGLALGLSAIDPNNPSSARASGIFTGIWSLISPLIALFIGGAIASRGAGVLTRAGGALHGVVMWGLTTLVGAWLLGNLVSTVVGGLGQAGIVAGGSALSGMTQQRPAQQQGAAFGLNAEAVVQPLNDRLRAEGKPEVSAAQVNAAARDVLSDAVRTGRLDREILVSSISQQTALSRADAEDLANRIEGQWNDAKGKMQAGVLKAADTTGKAFWGVFGALFLGLVAAVLGATVGVSRRQQALAVTPVVTTETRMPPTIPQQPVHP